MHACMHATVGTVPHGGCSMQAALATAQETAAHAEEARLALEEAAAVAAADAAAAREAEVGFILGA